MTGIQVVSWVKPKAVLSLASEWSSWCQQDLGAPTRLLWPVCRGHGRRVSASLGLLEVRGVTLTCSGHSLHPLPAGRPEHEDSSPLSRRTALPVVHLWIALPGHCKVKFTMFARSTTLLSQKCQQHWSVRALSQDYLTIILFGAWRLGQVFPQMKTGLLKVAPRQMPAAVSRTSCRNPSLAPARASLAPARASHMASVELKRESGCPPMKSFKVRCLNSKRSLLQHWRLPRKLSRVCVNGRWQHRKNLWTCFQNISINKFL
ncbi:uncharacterized protein LOC119170446 isoform X3 [Rhipicephalus microplus]|uniref:uncharacterized protein LOC119170446 isoform X3 n=1 Tax=Rhipicephalus microplus TaxID=6941 RepID=UPI003F6D871C